MRDSMIIYRSFYEAINELPKEHQLEIYKAMFEYGLNFNKLELKGLSKTIFKLIEPQIEANNKRFLNGSKPKKSKTKANNKQSGSKTKANNNVNVNNNENNKDLIIENFKNSDQDKVFMELKITPKFINKYKSEFVARVLSSGNDFNKQEFNTWWFNWLKKQPKKDLKYLTKEEKERRQVPTDKPYIHWQDTYKLLREDDKGYFIYDGKNKLYL